jgi:proteasome accessory factor C
VSGTAADQLRRVLALIPRIGDGEEHAFDALAEAEGVPTSVIFHDVATLGNRLDDPGGFVEGVRVSFDARRVSLVTSHFLRPMRLTTAEAAALDLGLAMLAGERTAGDRAVVDAARSRLREELTLERDDDRGDARAADAGASGEAWLPPLRAALDARRPVRIDYRKAGGEVADLRTVHAYALVAVRGAWYLVAHCERSADLRHFRLDRIATVDAVEGAYEIPHDFSLDALLADERLFRAVTPEPLRVRYSPRVARWIAERETGVTEADGSLVVEHPMADADWAARHVLQYGPDAAVLSPSGVRAEVARRAARLLAALDSSGTTETNR